MTALASGKRAFGTSYIFPSSSTCRRLVRITLILGPLCFVAETERAGQSKPHLQDARLRALASYVDQDLLVDANNCVVHAIEIYLARSKEHCKVCKRLLIAYKPGNAEEIKPSTTSTWIAKTFHYVHDDLPDASALLFKVRAHEIRGLR